MPRTKRKITPYTGAVPLKARLADTQAATFKGGKEQPPLTLGELRKFMEKIKDLPDNVTLTVSSPVAKGPDYRNDKDDLVYEQIAVEDMYVGSKRGTDAPIIRVTVANDEFTSIYPLKKEYNENE